MKHTFKRVITIGYYGAVDAIEGSSQPLEEGERNIKFPDGHIERVMIKIKKQGKSVQIDMNGIPDNYLECKAYFIYDLHGASVKIYLRNSYILVEK